MTHAQLQYKEWFDDKDGVLDIRGQDGFFSRWSFRHGLTGQIRASEFVTDIADAADESRAIALINDLLYNSRTAYHRHSFAPFLLDELTKIEDGPWSTLFPDIDSKLYDQDTVIEQLQARTEITANNG